MKISDVLKSISVLMAKPIADIKYKSLTEENLTMQIEDAKWALTSVNSIITSLSTKQLDTIYANALVKINSNHDVVKSIGKPACSFLLDFHKNLKGSAHHIGIIDSIKFATKVMLTALNDLSENVGSLLTDKNQVTIKDVQISHGLFLGVLEAARIFSLFNGYLFATLSNIVSASDGEIDMPKYMAKYLGDHGETYIDLINQLCNNSGRYSVINEITSIKGHGLDFKFSAAAKVQSHLIFDVLGLENIFLSIFNIMLRPIAMLGEVYIDIRHSYYESIQEKKKWLEAHTALMKMELENINHDDPEYIKMKKIIAFYDDKIAGMDKELTKYMGE